MSSIPISKEGFQALEQELDRLKKERPHVIQAIKEAREEGDLKENAGYDAARERQGMLEARIKYIESRMALFNVIDLSTLSSEKAIFGATVTVEDADTGEEREFTLLGPDEADYAKGDHFHSVSRRRGPARQGSRRRDHGQRPAWPDQLRDHRHPVQEKDRLISIPARGLVFPPCELPLRPKRPGLFPDSYMRTGNRQALRGRPIICTMPLGPSVS